MAQQEYVNNAHLSILVVEDEILIRQMLSENLREAGFQVMEAYNADEALSLLHATLPLLIISDVKMPGSVDGLGLLALVKIDHPDLPVIITSGHVQPSQAICAGADNFVSKPYCFGSMLRAVKNVLEKN